jgi:photosystem II stability/assembly factor-like uncharacterized protein
LKFKDNIMLKRSSSISQRAGILLIAITLPLFAQNAGKPITDSDPAQMNAEMKSLASKSMLLDITKSGAGYLAVGERGHIVSSSDGKAWAQVANVPTRATLTSIAAVGNNVIAAGHDGIILHSADAGKTWQRRRIDIYQAGSAEPSQGAPILDVLFVDDKHAFAVGAYSLMLETLDAGVSWQAKKITSSPVAAAAGPVASESGIFSDSDLALGEESDPHYNALTKLADGVIVLVGERGAVFRSNDNGATWTKLSFPYKGSMFGVMSWSENHLLAYGLRGNIYESTDQGKSWNKIESGSNATLLGGLALANGGAMLVGTNGLLLTRKDAASAFVANTIETTSGEVPVLAAAMVADAGQWILVGEKGADLFAAK